MALTTYRVLAQDSESGHWISVGLAQGHSPRQAIDAVVEAAAAAEHLDFDLHPGETSVWAGVPERNWSEFDTLVPERPSIKTAPRDPSLTLLGEIGAENAEGTAGGSHLAVVPPPDDDDAEPPADPDADHAAAPETAGGGGAE